MDRLSSDILLGIFKRLDCQETVSIMRVCTSWYQVIEENKSLWRRLVVRKRKFGLNPSVLAKFDEKSGSTLQKVVIFVDTKMKGKGKPPSIVQILERSKETLEEVFIEDSITSPARLEVFNELIYRLPRLVDCRLMNDLWEVSRVELMASGGNELTSEGNKNLSSLKVLWISVMEPTFSLHPEFLNNLSSLRLEGVMEEYLLRRLLDSASQTLKHLFITTASTHQQTLGTVSLYFPTLQVLEMTLGSHFFPSWISVPYKTQIIIRSEVVPLRLPPISSLSLCGTRHFFRLADNYPLLEHLRLDYVYGGFKLNSEEKILLLLESRKRRIDAGESIEGSAMRHLKTITLPLRFDSLMRSKESRWEALGVEKISSLDLPEFIEVQI